MKQPENVIMSWVEYSAFRKFTDLGFSIATNRELIESALGPLKLSNAEEGN